MTLKVSDWSLGGWGSFKIYILVSKANLKKIFSLDFSKPPPYPPSPLLDFQTLIQKNMDYMLF